MRYRNKPELQARLAAEYVLGTLRGRARARFQHWMRDDAALRRAVAEWEERLTPMAEAVAPVAPPQRVWREIEARIASPAPPAAPGRRGGFWESVGFWRTTGLVTSGMAAALLVAITTQKPQVVEVPVERIVEATSTKMQPSYVAVLRDETGKVVFMAYAARESDELWIKKVGMDEPGEGRHYALWGLTMKPGEPPISLGMIPPGEKATIKLAAVADKSLADFPVLALSIEPQPMPRKEPVGPVIAKGDCQKFW
jgi:anti-sigma-K factor RskA